MKFISIDTETYKVQPGLLTPKMVCLTYSDGETTKILNRDAGIKFTRDLLLRPDINILGHRISYDLAVMTRHEPRLLPLIFDALDQGRIYDTAVNQKLCDIATGELKFFDYKASDGTVTKMINKHSLDQYSLRYLHQGLNKGKNSWQLRFGELDGLDVEDYPEEARKYALADALNTWLINKKQWELAGSEIPTRELQTQAAWVLHLMSVWGCRTNRVRTLDLRERLIEKRNQLEKKLRELGFIKKDGTRNLLATRDAVIKSYEKLGVAPPLTEKGNISTDKNALLDSEDEDLKLVTEYVHVDKELGTFLPLLLNASERPFCPNWNVLVSSGRTSCGSSEDVGNLQQLPRNGLVRECFEPSPGYYYCSTDLSTAELRAWGQICLDLVGYSNMVRDIKEGRDPHLALGADILGISYERALDNKTDTEIKKTRGFAKIANFGFLGGLSPDSLVSWAKNQGVTLTLDFSKELQRRWFERYSEARGYFAFIKSLCGGYGMTTTYKNHLTNFVRGGVGFTELANHLFQNTVSCGAKRALYNISREAYIDAKSSLFGSRPVFMIHDEIILDMKIEKAHEGAYRQATLMREGLQYYLKDVPVESQPVLMTKWLKGAEMSLDVEGKLVPWEPQVI